MKKCPLCHQSSTPFFKDLFFQCSTCRGIFKSKTFYLDREQEKARYETHNNDVHDVRYQQFVSPITDAVFGSFTPHHAGLDFGAGPGPVISKILKDQNYQIEQYDPFFFNNPELLDKQYDYVVCCEVIEHFHHPDKAFRLLRNLLKVQGSLFCMTSIFNDDIDFNGWNYKNDETHVFIYRTETLQWIKEQYGFSSLIINERMIRFDY